MARGSDRVRAWWRTLGEPVTGRRVPGTMPVMVVGALIAFAASLVSVGSGANLWYSDALSHLTIARRIIDSLAPGFQQLGTVWLPVPHLLLMLPSQSLWLWSTGWSAALLGTFCMAMTSGAIYRIAARLGIGVAGRLTALAALWLNTNLLYADTTALTEPVLLMGLAASTAGMVHWATARRSLSGGEIAVYIGVPAAVATLSRYEGWALVAGIALFMTIVGRRRTDPARRRWRFILWHDLAPALAVPAVGILWWLAYNFNIYGNPLEFMLGEYSASAQQERIGASGTLTTKGSLGMSLYVFDWSMWQLVGWATVILGALGFLLSLFAGGLDTRTLTLGVVLSGYVFQIVSLVLGQTVMENAHSLPAGLFNVRYGLIPILFFVLGAGTLVELAPALLRRPRVPRRVLAGAAIAAMAVQGLFVAVDPVDRSPLIAEGAANLASRPMGAVAWLRDHYDGGGILIDEAAGGNSVLPLIGVPVREYWNRSTGGLFDEALDAPATHAEWILVNTDPHGGVLDGPDAVWDRMQQHPEDYTAYTPVYVEGDHTVYQRVW
jgi:hypothetical protein